MADQEYGGPWLQAAAFCYQVLQEKNDVVSLIRLVDRFTVSAHGPDAPEQMPLTNLAVHLFVALKSGFFKGSGELRVVGTNPSQQTFTSVPVPLFLEGDDRGMNANLELTLQVQEEGLYWFDVFFGTRLLTRVPLRVIYQRITPGPGLELRRG